MATAKSNTTSTTNAHSLTFRRAWQLLRETYTTNNRDILRAYRGLFARVDDLYRANEQTCARIYLSNGPLSEEQLIGFLKRRVFVCCVTLRRSAVITSTSQRDQTIDDWEREPIAYDQCRLYRPTARTRRTGNAIVVAAASVVGDDKPTACRLQVPATTYDVSGFEEDWVLANDDNAGATTTMTSAAGADLPTTSSTTPTTTAAATAGGIVDSAMEWELDDAAVSEDELAAMEDDEDDDAVVADDDDDEVAEEGDDRESNNEDRMDDDTAVGAAGSDPGNNRLREGGKTATAKGIRRQHWCYPAYRHFFHHFLERSRALPMIEQIDTTLEDGALV